MAYIKAKYSSCSFYAHYPIIKEHTVVIFENMGILYLRMNFTWFDQSLSA